jgi:hypothetical protein
VKTGILAQVPGYALSVGQTVGLWNRRMAKHDNLTAFEIGSVLQFKLGPRYSCQNPLLQIVHTKHGSEKIFKIMVVTGVDPNQHYHYVVSKISGKDMNDWLETIVSKIRGYHTRNIKELADDQAQISKV